jgi:hypothetical protein
MVQRLIAGDAIPRNASILSKKMSYIPVTRAIDDADSCVEGGF